MKKLAVYIHIPFCVRKCAYCDFNSAPPHGSEINDYIEALVNEIRFRSNLALEHEVSTVFIGGGTPSLIDESYINRILNILRESFETVRPGAYNPCEITIECNPGTVDKSKLTAYKQSGVNRISIGLQSANDSELKLLGRIHTYEEWSEAVSMSREAGFININTDLISGIPGQTVYSFMKTLGKVIETGIPHISVYSLIIEKNTKLYELYNPEVISEEEQDFIDENDRLIYEATKEKLEEYGYNRYEVSNYSKSGLECKHNIVYWKRDNYIGFGVGAASMIDNIRFINTSELKQYINEYKKALNGSTLKCNTLNNFEAGYGYMTGHEQMVEELDKHEQMAEFMILGLRMTEGISIKNFENCFGTKIYNVYGDVIDSWIKKGGLIAEDNRIRCTEYGLNICNQIFCEFM